MHTCKVCGEVCYCDGDTRRNPVPDDCPHVCKDNPSDEKAVAYDSPDAWEVLNTKGW